MRYQHYKGGLYTVLTDEATVEATQERAVVYQAEKDSKVWIRPYDDFFAEVPEHGPRFKPYVEAPEGFDTGEDCTCPSCGEGGHIVLENSETGMEMPYRFMLRVPFEGKQYGVFASEEKDPMLIILRFEEDELQFLEDENEYERVQAYIDQMAAEYEENE